MVREGAVRPFRRVSGALSWFEAKVGLGPGHEVREPRRGEEGSRERGGDVEHRRDSYQEGFEVPLSVVAALGLAVKAEDW